MATDAESTDAGMSRIRRVLESLGSVYGDDAVAIDFDDELRVETGRSRRGEGPSHEFVLPARPGEYLEADLSRDEEYELLLDTLNHLSYCRDAESWGRTESFVADASEPDPLAAFVHRMVEHAHVTTARLSEYRGLAGAYALRMEVTFDDPTWVDDLRQDAALLEGLRELAYTGQVAGLESAPENVRGTLSYAATELDRVRDPSASAELRDEVADRVLRTLVDRMYRPRTAERHLREELALPFQDNPAFVRDIEVEAPEDSDEETTVEDVVGLAALVPMFPVIFAASPLGYEDPLKSFYRPFPDGPFGLFFLLYPLLLPVFIVWGMLRSVMSRLGYWESIVDHASGCWNSVTGATTWFRIVLDGRTERFRTALGEGFERSRDALTSGGQRVWSAIASGTGTVVGVVNARLPGDRELDVDSLILVYFLPFLIPYLLFQFVLGQEPVDAFVDPITDWNPPGNLVSGLYAMLLPPLLAVLFPVFLLWLSVRAVALAVGVWEDVIARVKALWQRAVATPQRVVGAVSRAIRRAPVLVGAVLATLAQLLWRWWHWLAYRGRRGFRRARGDDWRQNLPEDLEEDRLAEQLGGHDDESRERDRTDEGQQRSITHEPAMGESDDDSEAGESTTEKHVRTADEEESHEESKESADVADAGIESTIPTDANRNDLTEALLADTKHRSTSTRGEVRVVEVEYEEKDDTILDDALSELGSLDRRTSSELQGLRADRDERIGTQDDAVEVLDAMRERGLDETIGELLTEFPPEERREVQAQTGYRLDLSAVARSAGGRLPNNGLFARRRHVETGSRAIGVSIDLSGSIDGFEAKVSLAAVAVAAELFGDEFLATGFRGTDPSLPLVTGPNEPFEPAHLSSIETGGSTPLAAGVREGRRLLKAANANERVLLVVTDGAPRVGLPGGSGPKADTCSEIERCRQDGVAVVGIGVGVDTAGRMADLFGGDAYVEANDEAFADRLLDVYRSQLLKTQRY